MALSCSRRKERICCPNTSADATCDEMVMKQFTYEKSNVIERCSVGRRSDLGVVLQHAGDEHDHNPSDYSHDSTATAHSNDDYNDAHGRRLLIAKARGDCVCG